MSDRDPEAGWKLDRRISIPDIVGVIGAGIAVVLSYATLDKRLTVVESLAEVRNEDVRQIKRDVEYIRRLLERQPVAESATERPR
jgi:hypothetical protein